MFSKRKRRSVKLKGAGVDCGLESGVGMNFTGNARGRRTGALPVVGTSLKKLHKQNRGRMSFQCNENGEVWEKVGIE